MTPFYDPPASIEPDSLLLGDCLDLMEKIPTGRVDAVICDPPYGTTWNAWDQLLPFDRLWRAWRRILKPHGAMLVFASQPFTTMLVASNMAQFKHVWYWAKEQGTGFLNASRQPLRVIEEVCVFYDTPATYNPQKLLLEEPYSRPLPRVKSPMHGSQLTSAENGERTNIQYTHKMPTNLLEFTRDWGKVKTKITSQKPVALLEYLIKSHTNPGEVVLDATMGRGTTGVACHNTGRRFIGIELSPEHFEIAALRILNATLRV